MIAQIGGDGAESRIQTVGRTKRKRAIIGVIIGTGTRHRSMIGYKQRPLHTFKHVGSSCIKPHTPLSLLHTSSLTKVYWENKDWHRPHAEDVVAISCGVFESDPSLDEGEHLAADDECIAPEVYRRRVLAHQVKTQQQLRSSALIHYMHQTSLDSYKCINEHI